MSMSPDCERVDPADVVDDRQELDLVEVRLALAPVVLVLDQLQRLAGLPRLELERAGADRVASSPARPAPSIAGARIHAFGPGEERARERGPRLGQVDLHGVRVDRRGAARSRRRARCP